ncbi:MAG: helix-turn-helix domain-containing protein, partial [Desulfobacterales bacterium]|nr:helix-turn-helix domain-containing protein [Desulfobacterales bacterium]
TDFFNKMRLKKVDSMQSDGFSIACRNVTVCKQDMAHLMIFSENRQLSNYEYLILEKCTIGLAQEFYGNIYVQERDRQNKELWVKEWLKGRLSIQEIMQKLQEIYPFIQPSGCTVCLVNISSSNPKQIIPAEYMLKIIGVARSFFEQQGFYLLSRTEPRSIIFILLNITDAHSWKLHLGNALSQISVILSSSSLHYFKDAISFSVGKMYPTIDQLKASHDNAQETLYIQQKLNNQATLFYDDLHVYRIIMALEKGGAVNSFILDYLQPVIRDSTKPDVMLKTLVALRDCHYNKIETAKQLFIARQSLYQRIDDLEKLLGEDFISSPQKRICLEIALYSLEYMKNN